MRIVFQCKHFVVLYYLNKADYDKTDIVKYLDKYDTVWSDGKDSPRLMLVPYLWNYDTTTHSFAIINILGETTKEAKFETDFDNGVLDVKLGGGNKTLREFFNNLGNAFLYSDFTLSDFTRGETPYIFFNALDVYWYMYNAEKSIFKYIEKYIIGYIGDQMRSFDRYSKLIMGYYLEDILEEMNRLYDIESFASKQLSFCDYLFKQLSTSNMTSGNIIPYNRFGMLYIYAFQEKSILGYKKFIQRLVTAFLDNEYAAVDYELERSLTQPKLLTLTGNALANYFDTNDFIKVITKEIVFGRREQYFSNYYTINMSVLLLAEDIKEDVDLYFLSCIMNMLTKFDCLDSVYVNGKRDNQRGRDSQRAYKNCMTITVKATFYLYYMFAGGFTHTRIQIKSDIFDKISKYLNYAWYLYILENLYVINSVKNLDLALVTSNLSDDNSAIKFEYNYRAW